jgi:hypothetical protein
MDTAFAQLTLRIISNQVMFWTFLQIFPLLVSFYVVYGSLEI